MYYLLAAEVAPSYYTYRRNEVRRSRIRKNTLLLPWKQLLSKCSQTKEKLNWKESRTNIHISGCLDPAKHELGTLDNKVQF